MSAVSARRLLRRACLAITLSLVFAYVAAPTIAALEFDALRIQQTAQSRFGPSAARAVSGWLALLAQHRATPESQQLRVVNNFWNTEVRGGEDKDIWRETDYWATPLETLGKQAGDCEDFVIAKYFSLVHMGIPPEKLRLIYVRARIGGMGSTQSIAHMVLGYYETPESDPLVLDNLSTSIMPASQRRDLTPVFSFNAQGIYVAGAAPASPDRISRWRGVLARMQQEGFVP